MCLQLPRGPSTGAPEVLRGQAGLLPEPLSPHLLGCQVKVCGGSLRPLVFLFRPQRPPVGLDSHREASHPILPQAQVPRAGLGPLALLPCLSVYEGHPMGLALSHWDTDWRGPVLWHLEEWWPRAELGRRRSR